MIRFQEHIYNRDISSATPKIASRPIRAFPGECGTHFDSGVGALWITSNASRERPKRDEATCMTPAPRNAPPTHRPQSPTRIAN